MCSKNLSDGFLPRPRRRWALASYADLIGDRYSRRELSDQFLRVLATAAPTLEFTGALTGDVGLRLGIADDPAPLLAKKPSSDCPRHFSSADTKLQARALGIRQIVFRTGLGFAGRRFDAFQGNLGFRQSPGHSFSLESSGHNGVTEDQLTSESAVDQQGALKSLIWSIYSCIQ